MIDQTNRTIWNLTNYLWNSNPYIWSDVEILTEILGTGGPPLANYGRLEKKKRRRVVKLICNIKGINYVEEKFNDLDKKVTVKDIEMLAEDINKHIKLEVYV